MKDCRIEGRGGVQPHQLETNHAEVCARNRPIRKAGSSQCAAVADAVVEDAPCKWQLIAVLPRDRRHFKIVMWLLLPEPENGHV